MTVRYPDPEDCEGFKGKHTRYSIMKGKIRSLRIHGNSASLDQRDRFSSFISTVFITTGSSCISGKRKISNIYLFASYICRTGILVSLQI